MQELTNGQVGQIPEAGFQPPTTQGGQPATPEQQAVYNKFVSFAARTMFSEKFSNGAVKSLKAAKDNPGQAIAQIAANVASHIAQKAHKAGNPIPHEVLLHGGAEIFGYAEELAEAANIPPLSEEDKRGAFFLAADILRTQLQGAGVVTKEMGMEGLQRFKEEDDAGAFNDIAALLNAPPEQGAGPAPGAEPGPGPQGMGMGGGTGLGG